MTIEPLVSHRYQKSMKIEMVVSMFKIELEITIEYYAERERDKRETRREMRETRGERDKKKIEE